MPARPTITTQVRLARRHVGRRVRHHHAVSRQAALDISRTAHGAARTAYRSVRDGARSLRSRTVMPQIRLPLPVPKVGSTSAEWRRFAGRRYRPLHGIAVGQAFVGSLVGDALFIPLLLGIGVDAAIVTAIATLPILGSMGQRLLPRLLDRFGGNLRGLTVAAAAIGETRGFAMAVIAGLAALGLHPAAVTALVAIVVGCGQTLGMISGANLQAWYAIVLPEEERRFVAPRVVAVAIGLSSLILFPVSFYLELSLPLIAEWAYAPLFIIAGAAGLLITRSVRSLPHPGRVHVPRAAITADAPESGQLRRFLRASTIHAAAAGLQPYVSIYVLAVLGMSPGLAVALAALASFVNLVGSTAASSFLQYGSASRLLRASFVARGVAMGLCLLAFPGNPAAVPLLVAMTVVNGLGWSAGALAANERLFRLTSGPAAIRHQGHYVAATMGAQAASQMLMATVISLVPGANVLAFGALFAVSGAGRLWAARETEVGPSWRSKLPSREAPAPDRAIAGA